MNLSPVEEFTTPNPVTAPVSTGIRELQALMLKHGIRHVPITNGSKVVGVVSERDIKLVLGLDPSRERLVQAEHIMKANPVFVNASTPLDEVAFEMSKNKIGSVLVYDDSDELYGIFTSTDALNALIEIVRDLKKEDHNSLSN